MKKQLLSISLTLALICSAISPIFAASPPSVSEKFYDVTEIGDPLSSFIPTATLSSIDGIGVRITELEDNSYLYRMGFRKDDIIKSIEDDNLSDGTLTTFYKSLQKTPLNSEVSAVITRDNDDTTINFIMEAMDTKNNTSTYNSNFGAVYTYSYNYLSGRSGGLGSDVQVTGGQKRAATITFYGSGIDIIGESGPDSSVYGQFSVTIDGIQKGTFSSTSESLSAETILYSIKGLDLGLHTITLTRATGNIYFDSYRIYMDETTDTEEVDITDNIALNKSVTASSTLEKSPWGLLNITDGITLGAGGWTSNPNYTVADKNEWVTVDLGKVYNISTVKLYPRSDTESNVGCGFPVDFTIDVSTDSTQWNTVYTAENFEKPTGVEDCVFDAVEARYVKVNATLLRSESPANTSSYRMQLAEIEVYQSMDDDTAISMAADELKLSNIDDVTDNISLPIVGSFGTQISWSSSNTEIISEEGIVNRPVGGEINNKVILTATITRGTGETVTKEFIINVLGMDMIEADTSETILLNSDIIGVNITNNLPDTIYNSQIVCTLYDKYDNCMYSETKTYDILSGIQTFNTSFNYPKKGFDGYLEMQITDTNTNKTIGEYRWFGNTLDSIGKKLQNSMIWDISDSSAVVFRKKIDIDEQILNADINIFADSTYQLWINGNYVQSGPARFDPQRPEYDSFDIKQYLNTGSNTVAVLVYGKISNGRHMLHEPGLAVMMNVNNQEFLTDDTWKCSSDTRFKKPGVSWSSIGDKIDAGAETGDCLAVDFDDTSWKSATKVSGDNWGSLSLRSIPMLSEKLLEIDMPFESGTETGSFTIPVEKDVFILPEIDFEAKAGTTIQIGQHTYIAKEGRQTYRATDSFATANQEINVTVTGDDIKIYSIKFFNRIYPFELSGSFSCSDENLTTLWEQCAYTLMQVTEDGYQDCPWERAEWMGDAQIVEYPATRVMMTGPNNTYSDPNLIKKMIRDTALSVQPDGTVKAHHPSDRFDKHAYIEDYSCIWIESIREYYENTGDVAFIKEIWATVKSQLQWFLEHKTESGLVRAREFIIFDNPLIYQTKEGATVNAYIYKALIDAAYLADVIGDNENSLLYNNSAQDLRTAYNNILWDEENGNFKASADGDAPNHHTAIFSLYTGIADDDKREYVKEWLSERSTPSALPKNFMPYTTQWLFNVMYDIDTEEMDQKVLDIMRNRWEAMYAVNNPGFVLREAFGSKRWFHNFGIVPAYFMSSHILGVEKKGNIDDKLIEIKPHIGDLTYAKGDVVTEHGIVSGAWEKNDKFFKFDYTIPEGVTAKLYIANSADNPIVVNGKNVQTIRNDRYSVVEFSGRCMGYVAYSDEMVDVVKLNEYFDITISPAISGKSTIMLASYNETGMLEMYTVETEEQICTYTVPMNMLQNATEVKVFLWYNLNNMIPLSDKTEINLMEQ